MAGLFRFACLNGLVVSDSTYASHTITHKGYKDSAVIDAIYSVSDNVSKINESVKTFSEIELRDDERIAFANASAILKWDKENQPSIDSLLRRSRRDDMKNDLFTTFNVVQENIMKGGIRVTKNKTNRYGRKIVRRSKKVTSVKEDIRLNKSLWRLTKQMADIKTGNI